MKDMHIHGFDALQRPASIKKSFPTVAAKPWQGWWEKKLS